MQEMRDMEDKQAEIYNAITSDLLTENPNLRASNLGPGRICGTYYRGLTDQERQQIQETNLRIIEENKVTMVSCRCPSGICPWTDTFVALLFLVKGIHRKNF